MTWGHWMVVVVGIVGSVLLWGGIHTGCNPQDQVRKHRKDQCQLTCMGLGGERVTDTDYGCVCHVKGERRFIQDCR